MCGIVGIYRKNGVVCVQELKRMSDVLVHRGPDGEGQWLDEKKEVGLAHRRLSILDLSENGSQPMTYMGRYTITFNGEIYNYLELREELLAKGYSFQSETDTEVILALYDYKKEDCLNDLDGMFAFAIWDNEREELFCARDRFGEKPFFYFYNGNEIVFASEMKAIFAAGVEKDVNEFLMFEYLAYDVVENPNSKEETFYKNIYQLPASHYLKLSKNGIEKRKYWDIDLNKKSSADLEEAMHRFRHLFDESVTRRMRSDVEVGTSLSGGVDSSSVVATILTLFPNLKLNTFTARFKDKNFDEGHFVEELRSKYSFNNFYVFPEADVIIDEIDKVFYHQEEPFGSTSIIAQWEVMKLARSHNTYVLLDGQGADETLAGYFKYFLPYLYEIRSDKNFYKKELTAINNLLGVSSYILSKEKIRMLFPRLFDKFTDLLRPYNFNIAKDLNKDFVKAYKSRETPFHRDITLNEFLYNDIFKYGLGKLLRFADRNAMAHSVEVRLPYLYHKLVEFVFALPANYKINNGWTKFILRKSMEGRVPESILYRKDKKGFQPPSSWLNHNKVIELANESFLYLKKEGITRKFLEENKWNYIMAYKLLTFEWK